MDNWITGAGHFGISVADLDESIDFYQTSYFIIAI